MKIRSVTCFVGVDEELADPALDRAGLLARAARHETAGSALELETMRIAVQPLDRILPPDCRADRASAFADAFEGKYKEIGYDYGALMVRDSTLSPHVPLLLGATTDLFVSRWIASRALGIDFHAIQDAAHIVDALAHATPDGFGNFRFAAAANCPPGVPFFPVAYADEEKSSFAVATEAADLAVEAFSQAHTLEQARDGLINAVERHAGDIADLGGVLEGQSGLKFGGIDFSLAPYPEESKSLATAFERLTGAPFGSRGTLFAAAFLTDALRRANYPRAGYGGLMLPVLEDWTMALRSRENLYSLDSLLLYSTVCGTGLDTVPLAGDTTLAALEALLLDVAALAVKLDKPLTARLIPVPGLKAGEMTRFEFEWFSNARSFGVTAPARLRVFDLNDRIEFH